MKIYMTGATGFIGKKIVRKLRDEEHDVIALLLPDEAHDFPDVTIVRGDITRPESLEGTMCECDTVVHLAGAVGYGLKMRESKKINKEGTYNVAREAVRSGIRRFIHFSSVSVYGRVPDVAITEEFPLTKIGDPYGDTKIDAEHVLNGFVRDGFLDLTIIRPTVIYGPGDDKFLPKLIENIRSGRARIIGKGDNSVDLIHVSDVADCVSFLLREERTIGKIYNVTNRNNPTWKELLELIATEMGLPVPDKHIPYTLAFLVAGVMECVSFFSKKAPRLTRYAVRVVGRQYHYLTNRLQEDGFTPVMDLREGIRRCVREYLAAE